MTHKLLAEFIGTALLLMGVIGSGIMADNLSEDVGLVLFQNAFATAGVLIALILSLAAVSGAHFNPAVTVSELVLGGIERRLVLPYIVAQVLGGMLGVVLANLMFELPAVDWSVKERIGFHLWLAEAVATFGLLLVIHGTVRGGNARSVALAVGAYIGGAYYFTSSTSFANPAVTIARTLSNTFAGISPASVLPFIGAQAVGTVAAVLAVKGMAPAWAERNEGADH